MLGWGVGSAEPMEIGEGPEDVDNSVDTDGRDCLELVISFVSSIGTEGDAVVAGSALGVGLVEAPMFFFKFLKNSWREVLLRVSELAFFMILISKGFGGADGLED